MTPCKSLFSAMGAGILWAALGAFSATAAPLDYITPDETADLKNAAGIDTVRANCTGCHSADYIGTQPKTSDQAAFWRKEVAKMIGAYGAPIDKGDVEAIVRYLLENY